MRWLRRMGTAVAVLGLIGVLVFPTDTLVRAVLARVTPPDGPSLVFRRAVLRPWGLRLDQPAVRRPDGEEMMSADWVRIRPSLLGILRGGRPWQVAAGICDGTLETRLDGMPGDFAVEASWTDLDLATCMPLVAPDLLLGGRTTGSGRIRTATGADARGEGRLRLRDAQWQRPEEDTPGFEVLHADEATCGWRLADGRLEVHDVDVHGPELALRGGGTLRVGGSSRHRLLDVRLTVRPGPAIPPGMQEVMDRLPPAPGEDPAARLVLVRGTLEAPQLVMRER